MARWITGDNAPGFLPEDDTREHETWREAFDDVKASLEAFASDLLEGSDGDADYVAHMEERLATALHDMECEAREGEAFDVRFQDRVFFCMEGDA